MHLHEYQAKQLFAQYGLPVSKGFTIDSIDQIPAVLSQIGGTQWVGKAQVHAGGRGKAGGVKLVNSVQTATEFAQKLLGTRLVTFQTDEHGQPVNKILFESCTDIAKELYLSVVVDRSRRRVVVMASTEGGVDIEQVAEHTPEKIKIVAIDPLVGPQPYQARTMGYELGLNDAQIKQFVLIFTQIVRCFVERDLALVEVNPLVITQAGNLHCLDAKVTVDDNAIFRQPALQAMRDASQEDSREQRASEFQLNYVALEGDIGCMVNGAGLAMATMDLIKLEGGNPANFLDVGGGATKERVSEAFKIILSDHNVKAILVNIFGGIVRCDMIAEGIIAAVSQVGVKIPVVVRLEGNNAKIGAQKLAQSGLNIIAAEGFTDAARKVVAAAKARG